MVERDKNSEATLSCFEYGFWCLQNLNKLLVDKIETMRYDKNRKDFCIWCEGITTIWKGCTGQLKVNGVADI